MPGVSESPPYGLADRHRKPGGVEDELVVRGHDHVGLGKRWIVQGTGHTAGEPRGDAREQGSPGEVTASPRSFIRSAIWVLHLSHDCLGGLGPVGRFTLGPQDVPDGGQRKSDQPVVDDRHPLRPTEVTEQH